MITVWLDASLTLEINTILLHQQTDMFTPDRQRCDYTDWIMFMNDTTAGRGGLEERLCRISVTQRLCILLHSPYALCDTSYVNILLFSYGKHNSLNGLCFWIIYCMQGPFLTEHGFTK